MKVLNAGATGWERKFGLLVICDLEKIKIPGKVGLERDEAAELWPILREFAETGEVKG